MRTLMALALAAGLLTQTAPPIVHADFSTASALSAWHLEGSGVWRMRDGVLALDEAGVPAGAIRKPAAIAILRTPPFTDFVLTVEARSTAPVDLAVRDVLLIFGYQSPTEFYYVHLAAKTDAVHNGIFLVNRADRRRLDEPTGVAKLTDQAFHRLRLERNASTGAIQVFFDADVAPMLTVVDRTLTSGRVGVGSFDETAEFRALTVSAR